MKKLIKLALPLHVVVPLVQRVFSTLNIVKIHFCIIGYDFSKDNYLVININKI